MICTRCNSRTYVVETMPRIAKGTVYRRRVCRTCEKQLGKGRGRFITFERKVPKIGRALHNRGADAVRWLQGDAPVADTPESKMTGPVGTDARKQRFLEDLKQTATTVLAENDDKE